ncbi:MAG: CHAT domain-containing protein [Planctomycetota bacterium]
MRFFRFLPVVIGAALAAWALGRGFWRAPAPARTNASTVHASAARRAGALEAFRDALERWRGGDAEAERELDALADELAGLGREDARAVLAHYRSLGVAGRAAGLALDRRHAELWQRVAELADEDLAPDEWNVERADVLHALDRLVDDARGGPDAVPLARALSLRARLLVARAEVAGDDALRPDEREKTLDAARDDAAEARRAFERSGLRTPTLEPLWIEGRADAASGRTARALERFETGLALARELENADFERHFLDAQIELALDGGAFEHAARLLQELARVVGEPGDWSIVRTQSDLLLAKDQPRRAVELLEQHPPNELRQRWNWRLRLANALRRDDRLEEAAAWLDAGRAAGESVGDDREDLAELALGRASIELSRGAHERALAAVEAVLAQERLPAKDRWSATWLAAECELRLDRPAKAFARLAPLVGEADVEQEREQRAVVGRDVDANAFGERLGLHAVALFAEACLRTERALDAAVAIERGQGQLLRGLEDDGTAPLVRKDDVASWARAFEGGLVTWVVGADSSAVVWIGARTSADGARPANGTSGTSERNGTSGANAQDGVDTSANASNGGLDVVALGARIPRGRRAVEDAVRRLREAITSGDEARADALGSALQDELVPAPVAQALLAARGRVLCLTHGPIERLALERLPLFAGAERVPVALPSLPAGPAPRAEDAPRFSTLAWTLAGAPLDSAGRELLPGAREELDALTALHGGSTLALGAEFTRAALESAATSGRALHVATHLVRGDCGALGSYAPVGLELANGDAFCARELARIARPMPLVFLSACETGGGTFVDAQGLHGVALAFLATGTRDLVVTLWPVEDAAARDFALFFHAELAQGAPPSTCAARARAKLREQGWKSSEWAAFRALGRD